MMMHVYGWFRNFYFLVPCIFCFKIEISWHTNEYTCKMLNLYYNSLWYSQKHKMMNLFKIMNYWYLFSQFILMWFWSNFLVLISVSLQVPRAYFGARKQIQQFPLLSVGYQDNLIGTVIEEKIENIPSLDVSYEHGILVYSDIQRDVIARVNISEDRGFSQFVI